MTMRSMRRSLQWILLASSLALGGCGGSGTLVVVTVHGVRAGASSIKALVTIDGRQAMTLESFPANVSDFGVELPAGSSGAVEISVAGIDGTNCIVSFDVATTEAHDGGRADVTVTLAAVSPPRC